VCVKVKRPRLDAVRKKKRKKKVSQVRLSRTSEYWLR